VESRNFHSAQSSHPTCSNLSVCVDRYTLSVLSLFRTFSRVLTYLYCHIIVCCTQRHTFSATCNDKKLLFQHSNIHASNGRYIVYIEVLTDRHVIRRRRREIMGSGWRLKCLVLLQSFYNGRQMKTSWQVRPTVWWFVRHSVINNWVIRSGIQLIVHDYIIAESLWSLWGRPTTASARDTRVDQ